jgi:hypothetical protein
LPAAIPSLVLSLQALKYFDQPNNYVFSTTRKLTKCSYDKTLTGFIMDPTGSSGSTALSDLKSIDISSADRLYKCDFPGSDAYNWLLALRLVIGRFEQRLKSYSMILNEYNLKNKFFNTMVLGEAIREYTFFLGLFESMRASGEVVFDKYFYGDLYVEFTNVYIARYMKQARERLAVLSNTTIPESAIVRPLEKISQHIIQI